MSSFQQILNHALTIDDIPSIVEEQRVNHFALSFNGYEYWGGNGCAAIAEKRLSNTLAELRTCLFFEHRKSHFQGMGWDVNYISNLLNKIQEKVRQGEIHEKTPDLNEKLVHHYNFILPRLLDALPQDRKVSNPLILAASEEYEQARRKLLIVGQETHSWYDAEINSRTSADPVACMQTKYREFHFGRGWKREKTSPFWLAAHYLQNALEPNVPKNGFMWSNLFCCDENKTTPSKEVGDVLRDYNLLIGEIDILKPDAVIFLTGQYYDYTVRAIFNTCRYEAVQADIPERHLAKIEHNALPGLSFRTYHPNYLKRSRKQHYLDVIISRIKEVWSK